MARIRTIKPEFWTDETLAECSMPARLLFIASLNFADDHGSLERSPRQLKAQAMPYDNIDCEPLVLELLMAGLFIEYKVADRLYLHIKNFQKHQRIEKKSDPRYPLYVDSIAPPAPVTEPSRSPPVVVTVLREGKGMEGSVCAEARAPVESETEVAESMRLIRAKYPTPARADWITAEKNARNLVLNSGATWPQLVAGVERYAKCCSATNRMSLNPARFFGDIDRPWSQDWPIQAPKDHRTPAPNHDAAWAEAKQRAAAIAFREPWPQESPGAYMTAIKLAENAPRNRLDVSQLTNKMRMPA